MGRSPFFTVGQIVCPPIEPSPSLDILASVKSGQKVKITLQEHKSDHYQKFGIPRSISVYDYTPSHVSSTIEYVVETDNYIPELSEINLRAIGLRDQRIPTKDHIIGWVITTDGYIRESEHFGILHKLNCIEILE
jgi:hypothetical protein